MGDEGGGGGMGETRGFLLCVCVCLISKMTFSTMSCKMYSPSDPVVETRTQNQCSQI